MGQNLLPETSWFKAKQIFGEFMALSLDLTSSGGLLVESFPKVEEINKYWAPNQPLCDAGSTDRRVAGGRRSMKFKKGRCSMGPGPSPTKSSAPLSTRMILLLVGGGVNFF